MVQGGDMDRHSVFSNRTLQNSIAFRVHKQGSSFIDNEDICKHDTYMGRRKTRDLFVTHNNLCINADVNGSYNIMKKTFGNVNINKKDICINPIRYTINANHINKIA